MATKIARCLVCGFSEVEVDRMHSFPSNIERSKVWQENMGFKFSGDSFKNYRICSRHFTPECYSGAKLHRNAVPTLFAATPASASTQAVRSSEISIMRMGEGSSEHLSGREPSADEQPQLEVTSVNVSELPSTSRAVTPSVLKFVPPAPKPRRSLFKGIENLSRAAATPRKLHLMDLLHKKEDHLRKVKKQCKEKTHDIKALSDLSDSNVVRNLFQGMPKSTSDFLCHNFEMREDQQDELYQILLSPVCHHHHFLLSPRQKCHFY